MADTSAPRVGLAPDTGLVGAVFKARDREDVPVYAFKGIPYAQPPVGELRFQPPRPAQLWKGDRQATEYGAMCMQDASGMSALPEKVKIPDQMSEDCLFINVWTPSLEQGARKPVMVWIHGGGFMGGWGDLHEGAAICSYEDVVFVSFNYRCGMFGFLSTGDDVVPGNNGLKDQIEALRWVQKYIHCFGGDPNNVTLYGESAGGICVSMLMLSDMAAGLFHKAISQSGTANVPGMVWSQTYCRSRLQPILARMDLKSRKNKDILNYLKAQPADYIQGKLVPGDMFHPVIDGEILREDHVTSYTNEKFSHIPYIVGCNNSEGAILTAIACGFKADDIEACKKAIMFIIGISVNVEKVEVDAVMEEVLKEYIDGATEEQFLHRVVELMGDSIFVYPTVTSAEAHCCTATTWMYYLTMRPHFTQYPDWVGADHAVDVHLINGSSLYEYSHFGAWTYSKNEAELSKKMLKYWANFARTGDPNSPGLPEWPRYMSSSKAHVTLNHDITSGCDLKNRRVTFWKNLMEKHGSPVLD